MRCIRRLSDFFLHSLPNRLRNTDVEPGDGRVVDTEVIRFALPALRIGLESGVDLRVFQDGFIIAALRLQEQVGVEIALMLVDTIGFRVGVMISSVVREFVTVDEGEFVVGFQELHHAQSHQDFVACRVRIHMSVPRDSDRIGTGFSGRNVERDLLAATLDHEFVGRRRIADLAILCLRFNDGYAVQSDDLIPDAQPGLFGGATLDQRNDIVGGRIERAGQAQCSDDGVPDGGDLQCARRLDLGTDRALHVLTATLGIGDVDLSGDVDQPHILSGYLGGEGAFLLFGHPARRGAGCRERAYEGESGSE